MFVNYLELIITIICSQTKQILQI